MKSLASQGEGGILDIDDLVCDVVDDREKVRFTSSFLVINAKPGTSSDF